VTVRRIVANLPARDPAAVAGFYREVFGLEVLMEMDFITTLGGGPDRRVELTLASQGGSGTPLPQVSIEVDDFDAVLDRARKMQAGITYGPADEPWGVRRFFLRDPEGNLVNVLRHADG
jgi:catechol 2,3-dioxygenase-like lactoylglutathione lyase family enzyme